MNKPKSSTIEVAGRQLEIDLVLVRLRHSARVARPGEYKVYRKGDKIYLEVFHNDV